MSQDNRTLYMPYGAYELKASYQRHLLLAMLLTCMSVIALVAGAWVVKELSSSEVVIINVKEPLTDSPTGGRLELPPPIRIVRQRDSFVPVAPPANGRVGRLVPIPDDELLDFGGEVLLTRSEISELVGNGASDRGTIGTIELPAVLIEDEPGIEDFVPHEKPAELVYECPPEYPRLSQMLGLEGTVQIRALVGIDGSVQKAVAYVSSGDERLDQAAVAAALKSKFSPALQNGQPIALWVTYRVVFTLGQ